MMILSKRVKPSEINFSTSHHPYRWMMLLGVWLVYFSFGVTVASMPPLINPITLDLRISHSAMGIILGAWPLIYIGSSLPAGALLDRIGPRRSILLCCGLIALSALLRSFAYGYPSMFLAVAVFGLGGPLISIGAPKVVSLWFQGEERGLAMGLYISGPTFGSILSLAMTNSVFMPLFDNNWRVVLCIYAIISLLCGLAWLLISNAAPSKAMERQTSNIPDRGQLEVFRNLIQLPAVRIILLISIGIFIFNHGLNNWLPEILRTEGMDSKTSGFWASLPVAIGAISAIIIPRLATPERRILILSLLIISAGTATLFINFSHGPLLAIGLLLQGVARGSMMAIAILLLIETNGVDSNNAGAAGGLFFSAAEIGGVLGPILIGVLYDINGSFSGSLFMMTGICGVLLILVLRLRFLALRQYIN